MCLKGLGFSLFTDDPNQLMEIVNTQLKKLSQTHTQKITFYFIQNKTKKANLTYIFQLMILKLIV